MAQLEISLFLNSLRRMGSFKVLLPNDVRADLPPPGTTPTPPAP